MLPQGAAALPVHGRQSPAPSPCTEQCGGFIWPGDLHLQASPEPTLRTGARMAASRGGRRLCRLTCLLGGLCGGACQSAWPSDGTFAATHHIWQVLQCSGPRTVSRGAGWLPAAPCWLAASTPRAENLAPDHNKAGQLNEQSRSGPTHLQGSICTSLHLQ
jgi:hypothetical protein